MLGQAFCHCCYFSTFGIPKSRTINGQATSPSLPHWPGALTSPSTSSLEAGVGRQEDSGWAGVSFITWQSREGRKCHGLVRPWGGPDQS